MPHLQFDINKKVEKKNKETFFKFVRDEFCRIMETGSDHIAVSLREHKKDSLSLGRSRFGDTVCLMNLDIRAGRNKKQKRQLAISFMKGIEKIFNISRKDQYVIFSEHTGDNFNLFEKSLDDWKKNDDPLNYQ